MCVCVCVFTHARTHTLSFRSSLSLSPSLSLSESDSIHHVSVRLVDLKVKSLSLSFSLTLSLGMCYELFFSQTEYKAEKEREKEIFLLTVNSVRALFFPKLQPLFPYLRISMQLSPMSKTLGYFSSKLFCYILHM